MKLFLVTEIYGRNQHVASLARVLTRAGADVDVVDPYGGAETGLADEAAAYERFLRECGPERYAALLSRRAAKGTAPFLAVGFSAGATAVWSLACGDGEPPLRAWCFYGSGIRHHVRQSPVPVPRCPVEVVLPRSEPHFDVDALGRVLAGLPGVTCHAASWLHGFMNPLSPNHDPEGAALWTGRLEQQVRELSLPDS